MIDDWEFFQGLARRMGKTLHMRRPMFGAAHRDIPGPEMAITGATRAEDMIRWLADGGRSSYDELKANPGIGELRDSIQRYRDIQKDIHELERRLEALRARQSCIAAVSADIKVPNLFPSAL